RSLTIATYFAGAASSVFLMSKPPVCSRKPRIAGTGGKLFASSGARWLANAVSAASSPALNASTQRVNSTCASTVAGGGSAAGGVSDCCGGGGVGAAGGEVGALHATRRATHDARRSMEGTLHRALGAVVTAVH